MIQIKKRPRSGGRSIAASTRCYKSTVSTRTTQKASIAAALSAGQRLTSLDAWRHFGCMRLAAVIHALRRNGWQIEADTVGIRTAVGKTAYVASYRLRSLA
jgi:hypothetical protein